jgi:hypothetical protein
MNTLLRESGFVYIDALDRLAMNVRPREQITG